MTAAPQNYTVHCLMDEACSCAALTSFFNYQIFMEGSLSEPAAQYCDKESSLSCAGGFDTSNAPIVDNQLTVTWSANAVIAEGDCFSTSSCTPENGDHDFLCSSTYVRKSNNELARETALVFVRGKVKFPT